jgi:hypothetical protein
VIVEVATFRLSAVAEERAFLQADERVQQAFFPHRDGAVRRTTARGQDGTWLVVTMWESLEDAVSADAASGGNDACRAFAAMIDTSSMLVERYETLD